MLTLYSSINKKKLDISPSHSDTLTREIMGDAVLSLSFTHWEHIPIEVGDYVVWEGERFTNLQRQLPQQVNSMEWRYQLQLFGDSARLQRYLLLSPDGNPTFTLTSPAAEHLRMVVDALNQSEGGEEWKVGRVVATDNLVIDYNGNYLNEALRLIAEAAHTEWWLEGKTINLTRCEWGEVLPLAYGKGLLNLERSNADGHKSYTRIYPIGSSRNIDPATYGAARLQLPNKAKFVDLPASKELGRIDHHEREAFSHIYPRRIGTITSMRKEQRKVEGKDIEVYFVKDDSLNFDPAAHLMSGKVMQFSFQEGADLAGREFECNWHAAQREFELITQWLGDGTTQLPNASLPPKVGDRYLLWNIKMPDSYLRAAEQELLQAVQAYNEKHHLDLSVYKARTDFEYFEHNDVKLCLGRRVTLSSKEFFADGSRASRVSKIVQHLDCPSMMDIEISDTLSKGVLQRINDEVGRVEQQVRRVEATLPDILRLGDSGAATDSNIYSAARAHREFLSKKNDDVAAGHITLANGATFGSYLPSLIGASGAKIDERGNAEVESIKVRSRMEVAELVVNRQTTMDADFLLTEGDTVEVVKPEANGQLTLTLRREWEGYMTSLTAGAVLRGIFNNITQGGATFETTWLKVLSVDTDNNAIRVSLYPASECPSGANYPPRKLLKISRWGHTSDATRQATYLLSSREQRVCLLTNVVKPIIDASNISSWQGKLDGLTWRDAGGQTHQLTGYGNVMGDAYVSGSLHVGGQLTGAIADKVEAITDKVNNTKVGGRNLFGFHKGVSAHSWEHHNGPYVQRIILAENIKGVRVEFDGAISASMHAIRLEQLGFNCKGAEPFTVSGKIRASRVIPGWKTWIDICDGNGRNVPFDITTEWKEFRTTHTAVAYNTPAAYNGFFDLEIYDYFAFVAGDWIEIGDLKIERGTVATDWTPAPEDVEWAINHSVQKAAEAKAAADSANSTLATITADAWRDGIITDAEGLALAKAKLEALQSEKSYLLARADAVLAAHPQLATTHPAEYNNIKGGDDGYNRVLFLHYLNGCIAELTAFTSKPRATTYQFNGQSHTTASEYAQLLTLNVNSGKTLGETYEEARNGFEAAIIAADRGKDGAAGRDGRDAKLPRITPRGTWEVWDWSRNSYIDTNDPARGESGANGLAPRINSSGYWEVYEGGSWHTTSIKAQGDKGDKGDTGKNGKDGRDAKPPRITSRGTWEVWDWSRNSYIDTNDPARGESGANGLAPRINSSGYWEVYENGGWHTTSIKAQGDKGDKGDTGKNGKDGRDGRDGVGVREVKTQYAISTSSTHSPSSGWSDTPIEWRDGYHLWRRTKTSYTDGTTSYTTAELDLSWKHERMTRLLGDNLQLKEVNVGAEKGVSFAGRFEAREKQGDQQVVRSFLNGLTNGNRPAFAAGVKDFDSSTESYATAFYHNGNAHIGVLAFENSGGAGSLHIVERGNPTHKLVELTDQRMPTGEQLAQQAKTTLWMVEGRITREFRLSPVRPPHPSPTPSSYWANGYDLFPNIQEFDLDETLTIGANIRTGNGTGKIRLELFPSNSERTNLELAPPLAPDIAVAFLNGGGKSIELCRIQGIGNVEIDLSVLKDLPPATYRLSVSFTAVVGNPRVKLTASRVGYSIDPDRPTTAICGDGFMAYHNKGQYTYIKDGVLYAKGELRIPGLLAHGVVTSRGTYQSRWGSRLLRVEHHNTGAYRIWHTIGHTQYSVNATPIDAGGLKVAQIAAQYADSVWVYIKDVEGARNPQGGFNLVDCRFAFSIIGHD